MTFTSKLVAWWQLLRVANAPTAVTNVVAGFLLARGEDQSLRALVPLCVASGCIYLGGMVLNDVLDSETDKHDRPERPIPSRRVRRFVAQCVAGVLIFGGLAAAASPDGGVLPTLVALGLVASVVMYNAFLKHGVGGPVGMAGCRVLNVLLGASGGAAPFSLAPLLYAALVGIYTAGLTWISLGENRPGWGRSQTLGACLMTLALGTLPALPMLALGPAQLAVPAAAWMLGWLVLMAVVARLLMDARNDPRPEVLRRFVGLAITGFIALDALVCLAVAGPTWAAAILALLVPTVLLSRIAPMS